MQERRRIVELWQCGEASVLVTLVRVHGSSYRRAGARMLIAANGEHAGAISGGCLEAEVVRKAQWKVRSGAMVERYSTLFDNTAEIPFGLGCGGVVDLLFEPAGTTEFAAQMEALEATLRGGSRQVVTQLPGDGRPLSRTIRDEAGRTIFASTHGPPVAACATEDTFAELLEPPQRLILFGAGDDARPMVELAALLGWRVTVVDGRAQWARPERFPQAEQVMVASALNGLQIDGRDAVVVMTHSYEQDRAWLTAVLPSAPRYLGLLGARHRSALLVGEVAELLEWSLERVCAAMFAPVGLDLGGDGADAIALAVVAEIQACFEDKMREGKLGDSRRMTAESVAEQRATGGAAQYLRAQCAL
jgi:xanthine dehydrogenase accessory factor